MAPVGVPGAAANGGEYPAPWATVAEARAKRKEAEARRRAAVQLQQAARQAQVTQQQRDRLWQAGQGRQQNSFRQQDRANIQVKGLARHKQIEAQVQERNSRIEIDTARQQEQDAQQDLAKQRRHDRLKAQQAQEKLKAQKEQEQFRQWQAQAQGQFDQWQAQQVQAQEQPKIGQSNKPWAELERQAARAAAVAEKAKAKKRLNVIVPLTPDVNLIIDSTYSDVIA